jgi:hypothetical protein
MVTRLLPRRLANLRLGGVAQKHWAITEDGPMPAYEIRYLDGEGDLAHAFSAMCDDVRRARVLAHAMKLPSAGRLEVWLDAELVYARDVAPMALSH